MRALVLVMIAASVASAGARVIDLDADPDGVSRLAEAAGACGSAQPASVQQWCTSGKPRAAKFSKRFELTTPARRRGRFISVTLPVVDSGKGLIASIVAPTISCDADVCEYADVLAVSIRTSDEIAATDIASVVFSFEVDGMWRVRQWWGPRATKVEVRFFNRAGTPIGAGTMLQPAR